MRIVFKTHVIDISTLRKVLVVNRFRAEQTEPIRAQLQQAHLALSQCSGYESGELGRNLDEPDLWVLTTKWRDVGSYRRALSSYDVKLHVVPILSQAIDEPSAYEIVGDEPLNVQLPRDLG